MNNFKRYDRGVRRNRLKTSGNSFYVNTPENVAAEILDEYSRAFSKRGYPDLTVYNTDGSIYGFIEIKPNDGQPLKKEQKIFGEFCSKHGIPFIKWTPSDGKDKIITFLGADNNEM